MAGHEGHRERIRRRFLRWGLEGFDDHNVLELLLFYALPRQDTSLLAHTLLDTFGSLDRVFEARPEELLRVPGVGENAAALLRLIPAAARRYLLAKEAERPVLRDAEALGRFFLPRFLSLRRECVMLLCLDPKMRVLDCRVISEGSFVSADFRLRDILQLVLMYNTRCAVLAHNHVDGLPQASPEDVSATREVARALALVDVELLDHIIVAGQEFISLREDGLL